MTRSAHRPPHHARSSGVVKHQAVAEAAISPNPAARAQESRRRPASGSARLLRATRRLWELDSLRHRFGVGALISRSVKS